MSKIKFIRWEEGKPIETEIDAETKEHRKHRKTFNKVNKAKFVQEHNE
jgi:hypothetical protein